MDNAILRAFSTAFQSHHDNGNSIIKGCAQWNSAYDLNDSRLHRSSKTGQLNQ